VEENLLINSERKEGPYCTQKGISLYLSYAMLPFEIGIIIYFTYYINEEAC
jgi:hypothetical protein